MHIDFRGGNKIKLYSFYLEYEWIGKYVWLAKLQLPLSYTYKRKEWVMQFLKKKVHEIKQRLKTSIRNSTNDLIKYYIYIL